MRLIVDIEPGRCHSILFGWMNSFDIPLISNCMKCFGKPFFFIITMTQQLNGFPVVGLGGSWELCMLFPFVLMNHFHHGVLQLWASVFEESKWIISPVEINTIKIEKRNWISSQNRGSAVQIFFFAISTKICRPIWVPRGLLKIYLNRYLKRSRCSQPKHYTE